MYKSTRTYILPRYQLKEFGVVKTFAEERKKYDWTIEVSIFGDRKHCGRRTEYW